MRRLAVQCFASGFGLGLMLTFAGGAAAQPSAAQQEQDRQNPEFVARLGERVWTREQVKAELSFLAAPHLEQARSSDNSLRAFALDWYRAPLFAKAAEADGLLAKWPGLAAAAERDGGARMIAREYINRSVLPSQKPAAGELEQFYKLHPHECQPALQYRLSRIVIVASQKATDEELAGAKTRLERVRERLAKGESFFTVAEEASDVPGTGRGGDMGWVPDKELGQDSDAEAIRRLKVGEVAEPARTQRGFEILKLVEKTEQKLQSLDECRPKLEKKFIDQFSKAALERKTDELMKRFGGWMNVDNFMAAVREAKSHTVEPSSQPGGAAQ
jgi:PPIC-type PPIASE domain